MTIEAGAPTERMHLVAGEPEGAWRLFSPGESCDVAEGEGVPLRPRDAGGAACTFAWSGPRIDAHRGSG